MRAHSAPEAGRGRAASGVLAALAAALLAGACSSSSDGPMASLDSLLGPAQSESSSRAASAQAAAPKTELDRAVAHWGKEYKDKPHDLKIALAYARNLKAAGHKDQAFGVLQSAALLHGDSKELASEYGRMALEYDQVAVAEKLLAFADDPTKPDWKLTSARGTVLAKQGKYADAIPLYERALAQSPGQTSVLNNLAMAHAANGEPAKAEQILRTASATSRDPKLKQNLALVMGLQGKHDEAKSFAAQHLPAEQVNANVEFVRAMVKPQAAPQATPAVVTSQAAPPAPAAKSAKAKGSARVIEAKSAPAQGMRPSGGPSDVPSTGGWSTTVQAAR
jgi:Flp pilus assembly protein TadD